MNNKLNMYQAVESFRESYEGKLAEIGVRMDNQIPKMIIRFKKLKPDAKAPERLSSHAAGFDLYAIHAERITDGIVYHTGIAVEIPEGYAGFIFMRSSVIGTRLSLANAVGVIDSDYRGEVILKFRIVSEGAIYVAGDRVGQLIILPVPDVSFVQVDSLSETKRGEGGFGSTGK